MQDSSQTNSGRLGCNCVVLSRVPPVSLSGCGTGPSKRGMQAQILEGGLLIHTLPHKIRVPQMLHDLNNLPPILHPPASRGRPSPMNRVLT